MELVFEMMASEKSSSKRQIGTDQSKHRVQESITRLFDEGEELLKLDCAGVTGIVQAIQRAQRSRGVSYRNSITQSRHVLCIQRLKLVKQVMHILLGHCIA